VLLFSVPASLLADPGTSESYAYDPSGMQPTVRTLFDSTTVASLLGNGDDFLRLCEPAGSCVVQSRFFSLILSSAQLVGSPFAAGSYLSINVGVYGTYFEAYYDPTASVYSDVRFVFQNFAKIDATNAPPLLAAQCTLPDLVGLSRTPNSGWSTSVFGAQRYSYGYGPTRGCSPPPSPPQLPSECQSWCDGHPSDWHRFSPDGDRFPKCLFSGSGVRPCAACAPCLRPPHPPPLPPRPTPPPLQRPTGVMRQSSFSSADCPQGTRILSHDLNEWYAGSGGHNFLYVTQSHMYKVYAFNEGPCTGGAYAGCPWDPRHPSYTPNNVCPAADAGCEAGPCTISSLSGGSPCALYSPTSPEQGCTTTDPCIFEVSTDPTESTYLTLEEINNPELEAAARWYFGRSFPVAFNFLTPTADIPSTSGNGYSVATESTYPQYCDHEGSSCDTAYLETIFDFDYLQTWDLLGALGTWVLGPFRDALQPAPSPPAPQVPHMPGVQAPPSTPNLTSCEPRDATTTCQLIVEQRSSLCSCQYVWATGCKEPVGVQVHCE